jgi:hypothetical protein
MAGTHDAADMDYNTRVESFRDGEYPMLNGIYSFTPPPFTMYYY